MISKALQDRMTDLAAQTADAEALEAATRRRQATPAQVDREIRREVVKLQERAGVLPEAEEADPELVAREEQERRDARRADNLRRMQSPVLVQRIPGVQGIVFRDDKCVREGVRSSADGA
jgi:hypothetical protein